MIFSSSVKYAIKAVLYLSVNSSESKKVMAKDLAKPINVPPAYIAKILQELVKKNIVSSNKGPKGGFYLTEDNKNTAIIEVIYTIDDKQKMTNCLLSLKECNTNKPCPLHNMAFPVRTQLINTLKSKSIGELSNDIIKGISYLPL